MVEQDINMSSGNETQSDTVILSTDPSVPVIKRARLTQENVPVHPETAAPSSTSNGNSTQNGVARSAAPTLKQRQDDRNGESFVSAKVLRPLVQPPSAAASGSAVYREPKRNGGLTEEESQYDRAVAAIVQSEKNIMESPNQPVADSPARAAYLSRLEPTALCPREEKEFPDVAQGSQALRDLHLDLRNRVLQLWLKNPRQHLVVRTVLASLSNSEPELLFDQEHLVRIVKCLNRMCLINFGDFTIDRPVPVVRQLRHVVVIGAGLAGLAAARQLRHFGFRVTLVEARNRVGGRVHTWTAAGQKTTLAESGAMLVTGVEGNPIHTILHGQIGTKLENFDVRCPIFCADGAPMSQERDDVIEHEFDLLVAAAPAHYRNFCSPDQSGNPQSVGSQVRGQGGHPYGLGTCIKELLELKELEVTLVSNSKLKEKVDESKRLIQLYTDRLELYHKAKSLVEEQKKLWRNGHKSAANRIRIRLSDLRREILEKDLQIETAEALPDPSLPQLEYPSFISEEDRRIISWHMANYDFANAIPVEELSVEHWDQDEEFVLKGGHFSVPGGLSVMTDRLAAGLCVSYNQSVTKIICDNTGVKVTVKFSHNGSLREIAADVVVSTLPLGVLKHGLADESIKFQPALQAEKLLAIQRLGYGVLNKVILTYSRKFWKAKRTLFGFANGNMERRGEFFMFWGLYDQPVLIALISGRAAVELEAASDADILQSCTEVLQKIFGRANVISPKEFSVTRWGSDEFSRGSYSSVPVGASGADFDTLAEPVVVEGLPRICFAGEHTARRYAGTMHGALLSGFREATRIADSFNGTDNVY